MLSLDLYVRLCGFYVLSGLLTTRSGSLDAVTASLGPKLSQITSQLTDLYQ